MTNILLLTVWLAAAGAAASSDVTELAGRWTGTVESPHGEMTIRLTLVAEKGGVTGSLETAHGTWAVTAVTEKDGLWTVETRSPDGPATMTGRIKGHAFSGEWRGPMGGATFALTRAAKP